MDTANYTQTELNARYTHLNVKVIQLIQLMKGINQKGEKNKTLPYEWKKLLYVCAPCCLW